MIYSLTISLGDLRISVTEQGQWVGWKCPHCKTENVGELCLCGAKLVLQVQKDYNERKNPKTRAFNI